MISRGIQLTELVLPPNHVIQQGGAGGGLPRVHPAQRWWDPAESWVHITAGWTTPARGRGLSKKFSPGVERHEVRSPSAERRAQNVSPKDRGQAIRAWSGHVQRKKKVPGTNAPETFSVPARPGQPDATWTVMIANRRVC